MNPTIYPSEEFEEGIFRCLNTSKEIFYLINFVLMVFLSFINAFLLRDIVAIIFILLNLYILIDKIYIFTPCREFIRFNDSLELCDIDKIYFSDIDISFSERYINLKNNPDIDVFKLKVPLGVDIQNLKFHLRRTFYQEIIINKTKNKKFILNSEGIIFYRNFSRFTNKIPSTISLGVIDFHGTGDEIHCFLLHAHCLKNKWADKNEKCNIYLREFLIKCLECAFERCASSCKDGYVDFSKLESSSNRS